MRTELKRKPATLGGLKVQVLWKLRPLPLSLLILPVGIRATTLLIVLVFEFVILTALLLLLLVLALFVLSMLTLTVRLLTLTELSALVSFVTHVDSPWHAEFNAFVRCKITTNVLLLCPVFRE
jgi:hypothetical protein